MTTLSLDVPRTDALSAEDYAFRNRHEIGLGMKPWFIENPDRLHWG